MYRRRFFASSSSGGSIDVNEYLTIEALQNGLTVNFSSACEYCIDGKGNWVSLSANTSTPSINTGQTISFKANNLSPSSAKGIGTFTVSKQFNLKGNCMSMLFGDNAISNESLSGKSHSFRYLFKNCTTLKTVSKDFLPATTLATYCYREMFQGCSSLTTAPKLPATTLATSCYQNMFYGCSSLTSAPELPATTLANNCYASMFYGCSSLRTAPELPATTLANYCYDSMFYGCTSLTTSPELPATTLGTYCYQYMFRGCSSLTSAPELPATTLKSYCYREMFYGCSKLITAPKLPATTLVSNCYNSMFYGCSSLTTAPELPATTLQTSCYANMFNGCSKLNYIKMLATTNISNSTSYTKNWVSGVAATGKFVKNPSASWSLTGVNGVPTGWTVVMSSFRKDNYLTINALESGLTVKFTSACQYCIDDNNSWVSLSANTLTPSINAGQTICFKGTLTPNSASGIGTFTVNKQFNLTGNCMSMLFGDNANSSKSLSGKNYAFFQLFKNCTKLKSVSESFLPATTLVIYCYSHMFDGCSSLTTAPKLPATTLAVDCYSYMFQNCESLTTAPKLPATTLTTSCYCYMFYGCSSLTTAPALPATKLAEYCYEYMFQNCESLTSAPALPATTLVMECYRGMFDGCSSLTSAPALPATTLAEGCYEYMFQNCESLTTAPALPATTLAEFCYNSMFYGCSSLTSAPALLATTLANYCCIQMFTNCSSLTTAPALPATTLAKGCYVHMFSGCTALTTAPVLPATTLAEECYAQMFQSCSSLTSAPELPATTLVMECYTGMFSGCDNLNYIKMLAIDISAIECLTDWVYDVADSGTFIQNRDATWRIIGSSGIPSGWVTNTVLDTNQYLTIEILEDQTYITIMGFGSSYSDGGWRYLVNGHVVEYDDYGYEIEKEWRLFTIFGLVGPFNTGDKISIKHYYTDDLLRGRHGYIRCAGSDMSDKSFNVIGSCKSICLEYNNNDSYIVKPLSESPYAFRGLFKYCTKLQSISKNFLPDDVLSEGCYQEMFQGCSSLKAAPDLPATTLAEACYAYMFDGCDTLTTAPELPASSLSPHCYALMFADCSSLTNVYNLPATTLAEYCYHKMFYGCISLKVAPVLPATTLELYCYKEMFYGCNQLNYIKMLASNTNESFTSNALLEWVVDVAPKGTFKKYLHTSLPTGDSGIPEGWTVTNSYRTPSIMNKSNSSISFTYSGGIFTPTSDNNIISNLTATQLLSMCPNLNLEVTIYYQRVSDNIETNVNKIWNSGKTLDLILNEIYGNNVDKKRVVKEIAIAITNISTSGDDGYYDGGNSGGTEAINNNI